MDSLTEWSPFTAAPAPFLVGRERERAVLRDHLAAARAGRGSLVLIGGEAGVGKTALAEVVGCAAAAGGALVLTGRCFDLIEPVPYGVWLDLFGRYPRTDGFPSLPAAITKHGTIDTIASQAAFFSQIREFLVAVAGQRPVVLVLEDLHWADPASLDLLRFVARNLAAMPLLIVATYRTEEVRQRHRLYALLSVLIHEACPTRCTLHRLTEADIRALVMARYRLADVEIGRLVAYLYERARGNAFFTTELLRALEEEQALRKAECGWTLGDLTRIQAPLLLRQVIDTRLARLGDEAVRLLGIAAVIGQEAPLALWQAVSGVEEEALLDLVERAVAARVLDETAEGTGVRFIHALIREALYEGALAARRRVWHRAIAQALLTAPEPDPDAVADHLTQAGDPRSVEWLIRAGEAAQRAYAWETAIARCEAALPLLAARGAETILLRAELHVCLVKLYRYAPWALEHAREALRLADAVGDAAVAALARCRLGMILTLTDLGAGLAEQEAGMVALDALPAAEIARLERSDPGGAIVQESGENLAQSLAVAGRYAEAFHRAGVSAARVYARPDFAEVTGYTALGVAYTGMGRPREAHAAFADAVAWCRASEIHGVAAANLVADLEEVALPYSADDPGYCASLAIEAERQYACEVPPLPFPPCIARVSLLALAGEWEEVRAVARAAREAAGFAGWYGGSTRFVAAVASGQGDTTAALALIREALPDGPATAPGAVHFQNALSLQRLAASVALDAGDRENARAWLEAHDRWLAWSGALLGRADGHLAWAAYHHATRDHARATEEAERARVAATEPCQPLALLAAHRLLGQLATDARRFDDATRHLDASLPLTDACAAPYECALTLLARAELRIATGGWVEAGTFLDAARALCVPLDAKPTLARVDALAARLAGSPTHRPASPAYPAGLTEREVEVLRLLAAGASNRAIGAALGLSVRTAERHINNIYGKTKAHGRAAVTAFATHHHLV